MKRNTGIIFGICLALYWLGRYSATPHNEHVLQAWAFWHGHFYIDSTPIHEMVNSGGHWYDLHPPLSAVMMMPSVAIWGLSANQTLVCVILGAVSVTLAWRLFLKLGLDSETAKWLTVFFAVGTTFWYEATLGASWDFALVASTVPTLLALNETFGKGRPWLVALWASLGFFARWDLALTWPIYVRLLWVRGKKAEGLVWMFVPFLTAIILYIGYNLARFGTLNDPSLWMWYAVDEYRKVRTHGPFSIYYLPMNLYTALFLGAVYTDAAPWIRPLHWGQAILLTSPAFVLALRANFLRPVSVLLAMAVVLGMLPALLVYANGFTQFGCRYWVQVFPFMLALMALGVPRPLDQFSKILIVASVLIVAFNVWQIRTMGLV